MLNTLFLRLEGVLQSWGERARWTVRDTATEPTKSGVVGLLACALGWGDDDRLRWLSQQIHVGVRCDIPGSLLVDYHTIVGGIVSAQGKVKINASTKEPETMVSWRHYLSDASFLVAIQSENSELIERLAQAVREPHWPIYLGRKSCIPSMPVYAGTGDYTSLEKALASQPLPARDQPLAEGDTRIRAVLESDPYHGVRRRDEIDSNSKRTFLPRYTTDVMLTLNLNKEG